MGVKSLTTNPSPMGAEIVFLTLSSPIMMQTASDYRNARMYFY